MKSIFPCDPGWVMNSLVVLLRIVWAPLTAEAKLVTSLIALVLIILLQMFGGLLYFSIDVLNPSSRGFFPPFKGLLNSALKRQDKSLPEFLFNFIYVI